MRKRFNKRDLDALVDTGKIQGYTMLPEPDKPPEKKAKYRNKRIEVVGVKFDSKKEYTRWAELVKWQELGIISDLQRQVSYKLSVCTYIADHVYIRDGLTITEDVKSNFTRKMPVYRLKKKLMQAELNIEIKEV